jgi:hypothetical protein
VSAVPADADALAWLPLRNVGPDRVDLSGNFMSRDSRILQSWKARLFYDGVTMAHTASFHFDPHLSAFGFRDRAFHYFEVSTWFADLNCFHLFLSLGSYEMRDKLGSEVANNTFKDGEANAKDAEMLFG